MISAANLGSAFLLALRARLGCFSFAGGGCSTVRLRNGSGLLNLMRSRSRRSLRCNEDQGKSPDTHCRHSFFPVIEGLSDRVYSPEHLCNLNNRTVTYYGEEISLYDATQQQRCIERQIRRWKREKGAMGAAGLDTSYAMAKIREWQARQRDFISQTGLQRDYFRERGGAQNWNVQPKTGIIALDKEGRRVFAQKSFEDLHNYDLKASNLAVRQWYDAHIQGIPKEIDTVLPLEDQARQAHELRNQYREQARDLMADHKARMALDLKKPTLSFDELVADKMNRKQMTRNQALEDIIKTATTLNKDFNAEVGLE